MPGGRPCAVNGNPGGSHIHRGQSPIGKGNKVATAWNGWINKDKNQLWAKIHYIRNDAYHIETIFWSVIVCKTSRQAKIKAQALYHKFIIGGLDEKFIKNT